jgi:hypothetical protein
MLPLHIDSFRIPMRSIESNQVFRAHQSRNLVAFLAIGLLVIGLGWMATATSFLVLIIAMLVFVGLPFVIYCFYDIKFGIILTITLSFFILGIKRLIGDVPLGLVMDGLVLLLAVSMLFGLAKSGKWAIFNNRISYAILAWMIYNILEAVNPWAASVEAWAYTVRAMAGQMVMFFIVLYALDSLRFVKIMLSLWICLALLAALWGLHQEYMGFLPFEERWVMEDFERFALLFQMGRFRKFSFMPDAMTFGFVMSYSAVMCIVLALGPRSRNMRLFLIFCVICMLLAMVYSGTRAAYVLLPVGAFLYLLLNLNFKLLVYSIIAVLLSVVFINTPINNVNVIRVQSAFKPGEDASYNTRKRNQKMIQPYLWTHPMGGGLGSTGDWGERFSPGSFLSTFPPDSGYMRIVVEAGPIGLAIYLYLLYTVMAEGIKNYYVLKNAKLKSYLLAMLCVTFALMIANFPQEATGQIPTSLFLYVLFAMICKIKVYDTEAG